MQLSSEDETVEAWERERERVVAKLIQKVTG